MLNSPVTTLLDYHLDFSILSAYRPIYLSLPVSTKETLFSLLGTSHQTTRLTYIRLTNSHVIKTGFPLLEYCSYSHTTQFDSYKCIKIIALKLHLYFNVQVSTLPKSASHGFNILAYSAKFWFSCLIAIQPRSLRVVALPIANTTLRLCEILQYDNNMPSTSTVPSS